MSSNMKKTTAMCSMPDDTPTKVYKLDENKVEVP